MKGTKKFSKEKRPDTTPEESLTKEDLIQQACTRDPHTPVVWNGKLLTGQLFTSQDDGEWEVYEQILREDTGTVDVKKHDVPQNEIQPYTTVRVGTKHLIQIKKNVNGQTQHEYYEKGGGTLGVQVQGVSEADVIELPDNTKGYEDSDEDGEDGKGEGGGDGDGDGNIAKDDP
ncbi:hypothetical protein SLS62_006912 [Diatrype stigma]|uniref:Uncharacterized protein n=1 Tax=Diatrype stigma TaxID=117547 RepID=A0AAN9YMH9_9PEZI